MKRDTKRRRSQKTSNKTDAEKRSRVEGTDLSTSSLQEDWATRHAHSQNELVCLCEQGVIRYINAAGIAMFGLKSANTLIGKPFIDYVLVDHQPQIEKMLNSRSRRKPRSTQLVTGRGKIIDVELQVASGGGRSGAVVVQARDISDSLRAAAETRANEARYSKLVELSRDLICVVHKEKISYINKSGVRLLGASRSSGVVGRNFMAFLHPDYKSIFESGIATLAEDNSVIPLKFVSLKKHVFDGELKILDYAADGTCMIEIRDITERLRSAEALRDREFRLHGIMESVADAIVTIDDSGIIQAFNQSAENIFGYKLSEVVGKNVNMLLTGKEKKQHDGYIRNYLKSGERKIIGISGRELVAICKDGTVFPIELSVSEVKYGEERLFTGVIRDITERKQAEEDLHRARHDLEIRVEERTRELTQEISERLRAEKDLKLAAKVIENLNEGVLIADSNMKVSAVNPAYMEITGFKPGDVIGKTPHFHKAIGKEPELENRMWAAIRKEGSWQGEIWNYRKSGEKYAERLSVAAIVDGNGEVSQYAAVTSDITQRKEDEERIRFQANYDPLTGLPNRTLFLDRLGQALPTMKRVKSNLGLMFIDLDGFKLVNDTLGHDIGDLLLKEASQRLLGCIRSGDTVARLGGDEFTVIMPNLADPRDAPLVAGRILDALNDPFHLEGEEAFVSGSIGITVFPDDATKASELIKNADAAMYRAKDMGKANFQFYTADLNEEVKERMVLKNGLLKAREKDEFSLHYQPKYKLDTGTITGVEALMRWNSPSLGLVSPVKFIPVMEESGQVVEVGEWALRVACRQHRTWAEMGMPGIRVAVNLSARQLRETSFVKVVERVMKETGVEPSGLEIEITESMLMSDAQKAVIALEELHDMGIHIAMDDFGTGYSSLSYLKRFPIDTIKIDRSFVADIATNTDDAEIIRTIITMGKTLNRKIVAEGVETEEQLEILRGYECDEIQGYFISRPLPAEESTAFLQEKYTPLS